ncbi:hypothetical protein KNP414_01433 [Paenibacillus mucilaginosus KNP414]|uniref:Uncharacterized protein n=1 Tax=Paenibacillus mucilaginosus (strain KNP414) TaxID=1036673 RepID=F8FL78_PAEMK|nr:hypothetical protein KNP414_01433 [Paenibacillus mucilaginosus KNP414]
MGESRGTRQDQAVKPDGDPAGTDTLEKKELQHSEPCNPHYP